MANVQRWTLYVIAEQLDGAFSTYRQNSIYFAKLILQWILAVAGFVVAIEYLTNFEAANFIYPQTVEKAHDNGALSLTGEQ